MALSFPAASASVATLKPGMQWTVEIHTPALPVKSPQARQSSPSSGREENIVGQGLRKETKTSSDGKTLTRYAQGNLILFVDPRTGEPSIQYSGEEAYGGPLSAHAFTEFAWVGKPWYKGQTKIDGVICDIFVHVWPLPPVRTEMEARLVPAPSETPPSVRTGREARHVPAPAPIPSSPNPHFSQVMTAYIASDSRLPVVLETPVEIRRYTFSHSETPLVLPAELAGELKQRETAIRRRQQRFNIPQ